MLETKKNRKSQDRYVRITINKYISMGYMLNNQMLYIMITMLTTINKLPSGYLTVRHGKSPFFIGKPFINGPSIPWLC